MALKKGRRTVSYEGLKDLIENSERVVFRGREFYVPYGCGPLEYGEARDFPMDKDFPIEMSIIKGDVPFMILSDSMEQERGGIIGKVRNKKLIYKLAYLAELNKRENGRSMDEDFNPETFDEKEFWDEEDERSG